jgi:hypothetical protein
VQISGPPRTARGAIFLPWAHPQQRPDSPGDKGPDERLASEPRQASDSVRSNGERGHHECCALPASLAGSETAAVPRPMITPLPHWRAMPPGRRSPAVGAPDRHRYHLRSPGHIPDRSFFGAGGYEGPKAAFRSVARQACIMHRASRHRCPAGSAYGPPSPVRLRDQISPGGSHAGLPRSKEASTPPPDHRLTAQAVRTERPAYRYTLLAQRPCRSAACSHMDLLSRITLRTEVYATAPQSSVKAAQPLMPSHLLYGTSLPRRASLRRHSTAHGSSLPWTQ